MQCILYLVEGTEIYPVGHAGAVIAVTEKQDGKDAEIIAERAGLTRPFKTKWIGNSFGIFRGAEIIFINTTNY